MYPENVTNSSEDPARDPRMIPSLWTGQKCQLLFGAGEASEPGFAGL